MPNKPRGQHPTEKSWYYLLEDETQGPVTAAQLRRLLQSGELGPDTLVWSQGMKDWVPARSFQAGAVQRRTAPPGSLPGPAPTSFGAARVSRAGQTSGTQTADDKPARPARHLLWFIAGAVAAMAILLCGVGIGYMLRVPAERTEGSSLATTPGDGNPSGQVDGRVPAANPRPQLTAETHPAAPIAPAPREPAASRDDSRSTPAAPHEFVHDSASRSANDNTSVAPPGERSHPPATVDGASSPAGDSSTLYQVVDIQCRSSGGIEGMMMTQERRYQILTRLTMGPRQEDKSRSVTQVVEQVRLQSADEMSRASYDEALRKMVGQQYTFTLNERNEITEFTGFQSTTANTPLERADQSGLLMATIIDEDGWKELMERTFVRPPSVTAGQVWRSPVNHRWGPLGTWRGITTYTPRGPEGYGVRYDFTNEMSYVPPEPTAGVLPFDVAGAKFEPVQSNGSFVFDVQNDHVISSHETFHVQGTVSAGLMGSTTRLQIDEYQEFIVQITNDNPWQK
jgi:hypothetical protein